MEPLLPRETPGDSTGNKPARSRAGFVLTGGRSSRMGRDKARLPFGNGTLVEHVAECVRVAAGTVALVGSPERYAGLGLTCIADRYRDSGPLGGLCTALEITRAEWNLIVACDMPGVTGRFLSRLFEAAEAGRPDCLIPETSDGLHPLCAVYHRRAAAKAKWHILHNSLKMHDFVATLDALKLPVEPAFVQNVNAPQDWILR